MSVSSRSRPFVLVLGNEKGGTGKSTLAMHIITSLLYEGKKVGSIDVDGRQGTLSRYIENRKLYEEKEGVVLPCSQHLRLDVLKGTEQLDSAMVFMSDCNVVVIDTPGHDTPLSRAAHSFADVLITPLNDSFIDLDLLVNISGEGKEQKLSPSTYATMVWEERKRKITKHGSSMAWLVVRNRMGHLFTRNKEHVNNILGLLARRIGFTLASGFGERVIFRELFLKGLTLLDLEHFGKDLAFSHISARQELRSLMSEIPWMNERETEKERQVS